MKMSTHIRTALLSGLLLAHLAALGLPQLEYDSYGGVASIKGRKTGWFHVEKLNGRWYFVTPEGNAFLSMGVTHADETVKRDDLDLLNRVYGGDTNRQSDFLLKKIREWHFNTAGYEPLAGMVTRIPYVAVNWTDGPARWNAKERNADVWSTQFYERLKYMTAKAVAPHAKNPHCIGFVFTDLPIWNIQMARNAKVDSYVDFMRKLDVTKPGKQKYLDFILARYENKLVDFNRAYGFRISSVDQIKNCDFTNIKPTPETDFDDEAFLNIIADQYYRIITEEVKKHAPHHLLMGDRLILSLADESALESKGVHTSILVTASKYLDVLSFQPFSATTSPRRYLDHVEKRTGKPSLLVDTLNRPGRPPQSGDTTEFENEQGSLIYKYFTETVKSEACLGIHRCTLRDHQAAKKTSTRQGILKEDDTEYPLLADWTKKANAACYGIAYLSNR